MIMVFLIAYSFTIKILSFQMIILFKILIIAKVFINRLEYK